MIGGLIGGVVEIVFGINAEGKSLEDITKPITAVDSAGRDIPTEGTRP